MCHMWIDGPLHRSVFNTTAMVFGCYLNQNAAPGRCTDLMWVQQDKQ